MRIMIDIGHPAHVHCANRVGEDADTVGGFFRNAIREGGMKGTRGIRTGCISVPE